MSNTGTITVTASRLGLKRLKTYRSTNTSSLNMRVVSGIVNKLSLTIKNANGNVPMVQARISAPRLLRTSVFAGILATLKKLGAHFNTSMAHTKIASP